jgi:hypothetical protein
MPEHYGGAMSEDPAMGFAAP